MCQLDKSTRIFIKKLLTVCRHFLTDPDIERTRGFGSQKICVCFFFDVRCAALGFSVDTISRYRPAVTWHKNRKHVNQFQG